MSKLLRHKRCEAVSNLLYPYMHARTFILFILLLYKFLVIVNNIVISNISFKEAPKLKFWALGNRNLGCTWPKTRTENKYQMINQPYLFTFKLI